MSNILSKLISCKKSNFPNLKSQLQEQLHSESSKSCTKLPPTTRQQLRRATKHPAKPAAHTRESPFTSQLRGLHLCPAASASVSAPTSTSAFCPCFRLCLLSLFPPLPPNSACTSVSSPVSAPFVFAFVPCLRLHFPVLPSLLSRPVFAFALRPPCAFASAFAPALHPPPPQHHQESPASPPPGNADLNSHPKAIIPSPSERLSPQSPGRARGPSSTPEQPLDCPLFRQFR